MVNNSIEETIGRELGGGKRANGGEGSVVSWVHWEKMEWGEGESLGHVGVVGEVLWCGGGGKAVI
jgi:hypothetical protein